jgi:acyl-CoA synthetase (AMP-forming)/AMP-acid ligase II
VVACLIRDVCTGEVEDQLRQRLPTVRIIQGYGMTEMSPLSHVCLINDQRVPPGSCGQLRTNPFATSDEATLCAKLAFVRVRVCVCVCVYARAYVKRVCMYVTVLDLFQTVRPS